MNIDDVAIKTNNCITFPKVEAYKINVDKIESLDDVRLLLKAMNIHCYFEEEQALPIMHLLEKV